MENNKHDDAKTKGFFAYVFNWNDTIKHQLTNLWQFITLAFIFLIILLQLLNKYYPIIDETKSTVEIILLMIFYLYIILFSIKNFSCKIKTALTTLIFRGKLYIFVTL